MKKLLLVGAFLVGMCTISFAQGGQGGFRRTPDEQVTQLKTQITGITDDQAAKIKVIYTAANAKRDSLMSAGQGGGGDRQAMMKTFMSMNTATDAKISAVLTADQAAAYKKIADARMEQMKQYMNQ